MATNKSQGPPPRHRLADFAEDVIKAKGDWVQLDIEDKDKRNVYTQALKHIGQEYAEVTQVKDVLYGRLKES
ncbi:hypothetical protein LCGC14_3038300 [marine sediment metagenome]|uniref:Uncharacterized protein n=1 Tax=marine sediment metagenome TaxID=412755 RepID=A0A0F8WQ48_9ZZZZ